MSKADQILKHAAFFEKNAMASESAFLKAIEIIEQLLKFNRARAKEIDPDKDEVGSLLAITNVSLLSSLESLVKSFKI